MQYKVNPSWLAVKPLHNATLKIKTLEKSEDDSISVRKIHITTLCIPVTYDFVLDNVPGLQERPPVPPSTDDPAYIGTDLPPKGFDFILHVGVAGPGSISIETLAHKLGYEKPDASGRYAPIVQSGGKGKVSRGFAEGYEKLADELQTQIDVPQLVRHLEDTGVKVSAFRCTSNLLMVWPAERSTIDGCWAVSLRLRVLLLTRCGGKEGHEVNTCALLALPANWLPSHHRGSHGRDH